MKWVYTFGDGKAEGGAKDKDLLGDKGANLAEMSSLGIPVPAGFTISTEVCTYYYDNEHTCPPDLNEEVEEALAEVERIMGAKFGATEGPLLLVSVRSGTRASMPGMMDTVLNLGLNDQTVLNLARNTGDERFAYDSYQRFIQMYSYAVLGVSRDKFEHLLEQHKERVGKIYDVELSPDDWKALITEYMNEVRKHIGKEFPQDPHEQLWGAIGAVFGSWMNKRAITYRKLNNIPDHWGTAVNVQAMVFGNMGEDSATGVCFSRDPFTGENAFYGKYLVNAQSVLWAERTPQPLSLAEKKAMGSDLPAMEEVLAPLYHELVNFRDQLERHYRDMQEMEFTIQKSKLWMLQTRNGKRTAQAGLRIAVEMCEEGLIDEKEVVRRVDPAALELHPIIDPMAKKEVLGRGSPATPGVASGQIVFSAKEAKARAGKGKEVIMTCIDISDKDRDGVNLACGILSTTLGGRGSHAAHAARDMGIPCVSGPSELRIDYGQKTLIAGSMVINEGDVVTIDGSTGQVLKGEVPNIQPELTGNIGKLMNWVDETRTLKVRANAETPVDALTARNFGCEGIGLCPTEFMFIEPQRATYFCELFVAANERERRRALDKLLPYHRSDFIELFAIMGGLPVTVRLLDHLLHGFLPRTEADLAEVAEAASKTVEEVKAKVVQLRETSHLLGLRGCRLAIAYPEIYEMQCRAVFEAVVEAMMRGSTVLLEIVLPFITTKGEFVSLNVIVDRVADKVMRESGVRFKYLVGAAIELPRAVLIADEIAESAQFFSFYTRHLTQMTYGLFPDNPGDILVPYQELGFLPNDPFATIDQKSVGQLVKIACERGRKTRSEIELGLCGEHGDDPASVHFCRNLGLNYISCSPYRVPIARLAAAQAELMTHGAPCAYA